jgi:hypothetical protein
MVPHPAGAAGVTYGTEAVMRLASWAGVPALGFAFATGFVANELVHRHGFPNAVPVVVSAGEELSEAPPARLTAPRPVEEIDLTCQAYAFGPQSTEPPLAVEPASMFQKVNFELPAGSPDDGVLPRMPYLTDDAAPAMLPPLGDVPALAPVPDADNLLFKAVKKYVSGWTTADVTDKVPLGTPPVSEHPSAVAPNKP